MMFLEYMLLLYTVYYNDLYLDALIREIHLVVGKYDKVKVLQERGVKWIQLKELENSELYQ